MRNYNRKFFGSIFVFLLNVGFAQTIINTWQHPIGFGTDIKDPKSIKVTPVGIPVNQKVQITSPTGIARLFIDTSAIVAVPYQSGGVNSPGTSVPIDVSLPVGATNGSYYVTPYGTGGYVIPIVVPPGTAGMTPSLSIKYSNSVKNGIMGKGWNLTGLTAITRVNKDHYHDGILSPINLNNLQDAFSLDGNRLLPSATSFCNSNIPGGNDYVLENENFSCVRYVPGSGSAGDYFIVQRKDGITIEYGNSADSKLQILNFNISTPLVTATWYVSKMYDTYGNYMNYTYTSVGNIPSGGSCLHNELAISKIDYTGNSSQNISPYNSIKFFYDTRDDQEMKFLQGTALVSSLILREIEVDCEGVMMKKYDFTYGKNNIGDSYLNQVQETGNDHSVLNPTIIEYGSQPSSSSPFTLGTAGGLDNSLEYRAGDFNGDGKSDLVGFGYSTNGGIRSYNSMQLFINQDDGTNFAPATGQGAYQVFNPPLLPFEINFFTPGLTPVQAGLQSIDVNADGMDDLILGNNQNSMQSFGNGKALTFQVYISTGNGFAPFYDIDDIPGVDQSNFPLETTIFDGSTCVLADINGDKLAELVVFYRAVYTVFSDPGPNMSETTGFEVFSLQQNSLKHVISSTFRYRGLISQNNDRFVGLTPVDFDGDGASELLSVRLINNQPHYDVLKFNMASDYSSLTISELFTSSSIANNNQIYPGDLNGDNVTDYVLIPSSGSSSLGLGNGSTLSTNSWYYNKGTISSTLGFSSTNLMSGFCADINGDQKADFVQFDGNATTPMDIRVFFSNNLSCSSPLSMHTLQTVSAIQDNISTADLKDQLLGDFDGDGRKDYFYETSNNSRKILYFDKSGKGHLLSGVIDGNGNKTSFDFESLAKSSTSNNFYEKISTPPVFPVIQIQGPVYVPVGVTTPDGLGGTNTISYTYKDAEVELQGGGYLGFGTFTQTNANTQYQTVNEYTTLTKNVSAGGNNFTIRERVPLSSKVFNLQGSNTPRAINEVNYTFSMQSVSGGPALEHYITLDNSKTKNYITGATTSSVFQYDSYGNPLSINTNINGIETNEIINAYDVVSLLPNVPTFQTSRETKITRQGKALYKRKATYAPNNHGQITAVTQDPQADIPNPGFSQKEVVVNYTYNNFGQISSKQIGSGTDLNVVSENTGYDYDSRQRFLSKYTNALNQVIEVVNDPQWGNLISVKGIDGLFTKYAYDAFGRSTEIITPDNLTTSVNYDWVSAGEVFGDPIILPNLIHKISYSKPGSPSATEYHDLFGRTIRTKTQSLNSDVFSYTLYDNRGNLQSTSNPYEIPGNGLYVPATSNYSYDVLGRVSDIVTTDGTNPNTTSLSYNYPADNPTGNGNTIYNVTTNDNRSFSKVYDATGVLLQSGDDEATLTYDYESNHQVSAVYLNGNTISPLAQIEYDAYARRKKLTEKNTGVSFFEYDAYGNLHSQTDNNNKTYTVQYDVLERIQTINGPSGDGPYVYSYVGLGNGLNLPESVSANGITTSYSYDALSRLTKKEETIDNTLFATKYDYDNFNNISKITYPGGFATEFVYDNKGYINKINRADNNNTIWQVNTVNPLGQFTGYTLGNSINVQKTFTNLGYPTNYTAQAGTNTIQNYDLNFEPKNGNLMARTDNSNGRNFTETFTYDKINRLKTIDLGGTAALNMNYLPNGNIQDKSDVGAYTYDPVKVNAVAAVTDPFGIISPNTQTIDYTEFSKTKVLKETDPITNQTISELDITYGPDQERRKTELFDAGGNKINTIYFQDNFEKIVSGNNTTEISYIGGGDGLCAIYVDQNGTGNLYYVFKDHLGSILKLTDANGNTVSEQSFDAWGRKRDPDNWSNYSLSASPPSWLIRGFTGHEHLPEFNLVNMNGRMYDPITARVVSADEVVQDGENTQSFNRYSYCLNNPLKYTDPTGYESNGEDYDWGDGPYDGGYGGYIPFINGDLLAPDWDIEMMYSLPEVTYTDYYDVQGFNNDMGEGENGIGANAEYMQGGGYGADDETEADEDDFGEGFISSFNPSNIWQGIKNTFTTKAGIADLITNTATLGFYGVYRDNANVIINIANKNYHALGQMTGNTVLQVGLAAAGLRVAKGVGNISVPVYRVYGGISKISGKSYTLFNPKYVPFYRNFAGLPTGNTGQFLLKGYVPIRDLTIGRLFAAPMDGNTGGLPIELYQNYSQLTSPSNVILSNPF